MLKMDSSWGERERHLKRRTWARRSNLMRRKWSKIRVSCQIQISLMLIVYWGSIFWLFALVLFFQAIYALAKFEFENNFILFWYWKAFIQNHFNSHDFIVSKFKKSKFWPPCVVVMRVNPLVGKSVQIRINTVTATTSHPPQNQRSQKWKSQNRIHFYRGPNQSLILVVFLTHRLWHQNPRSKYQRKRTKKRIGKKKRRVQK